MYVKGSIAVPAQAFPGESAWKLRITYSNKGSESHISTGKRFCLSLPPDAIVLYRLEPCAGKEMGYFGKNML